jgi:Fungal specific transcription factor domain
MVCPKTVFGNFLHESVPSVGTAPPDVINHLRACRPHQVRERAWLVMYYSIILSTVTSTSLKEKLHSNIWLALSDVGVLLEPSEANITAMVLVLSQASDFTGPSLCWMLATNACRMLQALGVNQRYLDQNTLKRRQKTFWHLNLLDKGLAIIFGRTPTFHREMVKEIGLPTLEQIQPFRPHITSTGAPGFFGAHYMYQKVLLSHLMDDIWHCLYGEEKQNAGGIEAASKDLLSWYERARRVR